MTTAAGSRAPVAPLGQLGGQQGGRHLPGDRVGVDEAGAGAAVGDGVGRGRERGRGHQHVVAGGDADLEQGEMQGGGARRQGDGVGHAAALGQLGFEGVEVGSDGRDPARLEGGQQRRPLRRPHVGRRQPDPARLGRSRGVAAAAAVEAGGRPGGRGADRRPQLRHRRLALGADARCGGPAPPPCEATIRRSSHNDRCSTYQTSRAKRSSQPSVVAPVHLGPAGEAGPHRVAAVLGRRVAADVRHRQGPGPDEAHLAPQHVPELGQLVEAEGSEEPAESGEALARRAGAGRRRRARRSWCGT